MLLTLKQVAERLHMHAESVRRLKNKGRIGYRQHCKNGTLWFTEEQVAAYERSITIDPLCAEDYYGDGRKSKARKPAINYSDFGK